MLDPAEAAAVAGEFGSWTTELGGQTRIAVGPVEALGDVRDAWTAALERAD
jgi:hypothetical protein